LFLQPPVTFLEDPPHLLPGQWSPTPYSYH
jgi:hypothetical protein